MVQLGLGALKGGGVGDLLLYPNYSAGEAEFYERSVFDFMFFAVVVMILL